MVTANWRNIDPVIPPEKRDRNEATAHNERTIATSAPATSLHCLVSRMGRVEPFVGHDALDVLDHDHGVVDDDTDGEHQPEQRQHVDRKPGALAKPRNVPITETGTASTGISV